MEMGGEERLFGVGKRDGRRIPASVVTGEGRLPGAGETEARIPGSQVQSWGRLPGVDTGGEKLPAIEKKRYILIMYSYKYTNKCIK